MFSTLSDALETTVGSSAPLGFQPLIAGRSGFRGVSFHYIVASKEAVDEVMAQAVAAGAVVVKAAEGAQWGYFGYFSDPDGYLWKVASGS